MTAPRPSILVREMRADELSMVLRWRNDPDVRRSMHTRHPITESEHQTWFERCRADPGRTLLLVERDGSAFGFVQFARTHTTGEAEWGFYVAPGSPRGSGTLLGRAALHHAFVHMGLDCVRGEALDTNAASIALHQRLGFARCAADAPGVVRFELRVQHWRHDV